MEGRWGQLGRLGRLKAENLAECLDHLKTEANLVESLDHLTKEANLVGTDNLTIQIQSSRGTRRRGW